VCISISISSTYCTKNKSFSSTEFHELNSIHKTLHYICSESEFELRLSHLFTLIVEFLTIRLLDKKNSSNDCKIVEDFNTFLLVECLYFCIESLVRKFCT
jgi:hypothetical protein